jgi:hypothetical protein
MRFLKMIKNVALILLVSIPHAGYSQGDKPVPASVDRVAYSNDTIIYKKISSGLFASNKGDIAYRTTEILNDNGDTGVRYISWIYGADTADASGNAGLMEMKSVIDTTTFRFLSWVYWSDKNMVYGYTPMSDGGTVYRVRGADPLSFKALGESPYGKDQKNVFYKGEIIHGADVKSFKTIKDESLPELARDKNRYYFSGTPVTRAALGEMKRK